MAVIRASELSSYKYCRRAWWYQKRGYKADNLSNLKAGEQLHQRHGSGVLITPLLKYLAFVLITIAIILFLVYFVS